MSLFTASLRHAKRVKLRLASLFRNENGFTSLMEAAHDGRVREIKRLIPFGGAHLRDRDGYTPLMLAASAGSLGGIKALLSVSDAHARSLGGRDALMLAGFGGHAECVRALLPFSNPLMASNCGRTALLDAAFAGSSRAVELLLPCSQIDARCNEGMSVSEHAENTRARRVIGRLVAAQVAADERDALAGEISEAPAPRRSRSL